MKLLFKFTMRVILASNSKQRSPEPDRCLEPGRAVRIKVRLGDSLCYCGLSIVQLGEWPGRILSNAELP
jgi:hypothetical protein